MPKRRVRYEFNRPFVEAKDYQENDALAVEATGYALQTIFLMEGGGVTFTQVTFRGRKSLISRQNTVGSQCHATFSSNISCILG